MGKGFIDEFVIPAGPFGNVFRRVHFGKWRTRAARKMGKHDIYKGMPGIGLRSNEFDGAVCQPVRLGFFHGNGTFAPQPSAGVLYVSVGICGTGNYGVISESFGAFRGGSISFADQCIEIDHAL